MNLLTFSLLGTLWHCVKTRLNVANQQIATTSAFIEVLALAVVTSKDAHRPAQSPVKNFICHRTVRWKPLVANLNYVKLANFFVISFDILYCTMFRVYIHCLCLLQNRVFVDMGLGETCSLLPHFLCDVTVLQFYSLPCSFAVAFVKRHTP